MTTTRLETRHRDGRQRFATVDCDVHPHLRNGIASLAPYLSEAWRGRLFGASHGEAWAKDIYASEFTLPKNDLYINPVGVVRRDAAGVGDEGPSSVPAKVAAQLLDEFDIDRCVLVPGNTLGLGGLADPDAAAAIAGATNDWLSEQWLATDERFRASIVVAPQDPQLAAAEIDRVGERPGFVQVFLPLLDALMGDRRYYPLYEAAHEHGLPIAIHPNSIDGIYRTGPPLAGGTYVYYVEWHTALTQIFQANVISLICQGVFERFPRLKVIVAEGGFAWLPDVMWRLDKNWKALRTEVPWLTRLPSEILVDHVRFTTQPFIEPRQRKHVLELCEMINAETVLLFSSDYPHWDFDSPLRALASLPADMRSRIMSENAADLYGARL
jgi:predicted TIM-barrel fold metal-dependent hydrolase